MTQETSIVGSFPVEGCTDETTVMNYVLNTAQANAIMFKIAHDDTYRPSCKIGYDGKGVTSIGILRYDEWKLWRRKDFGVHRIHDPHTLGPVYAYNPPGPVCDQEYVLSEDNIEHCRSKYSISMGL